MANSLIEELPKIVAQGKKEAERILEGLSKSNRITLQTNELVLPTKAGGGYFGQNIKTDSKNDWFNRLIYGDNLLVMQALLAGDGNTPSMRGKNDLIYIDPRFDSKADYRTKIHLPGTNIEAKPIVIEQFAYSDTWKDGAVFRSKWQDYRENTFNDNDPFRVIKSAKLMVPKKQGSRKVCVKAVDVFGFESVAVQEIK